MLPTPSTSHVGFDRIYEPAEDSFLLLDTLSSASEVEFLTSRFAHDAKQLVSEDHLSNTLLAPLIVEVGTGSGVVIAFINSNAEFIFGRDDILALGIDINPHASTATQETVRFAAQERAKAGASHGAYMGSIVGDLLTPLRSHTVDVLVFNPPYVPTPELSRPLAASDSSRSSFEEDSKFLELSYAGGVDGMEVTNKLLMALPDLLSARGVAYVLLCAQNKPDTVKAGIKNWGSGWAVETVGSSGKKAGWEKLQIIRIERCID